MATEDYWIDTGKPDLYLAANLDLVTGRRPQHRCEPIAAGADVHPDAVVVDSIVDAGATVHAGAHVERSVILAGAVVETGAVVVDSVAMGHVRSGASVHDSVIGAGAVVDAAEELRSVRRPDPDQA